ncbi:hypothetical protein K4L04_01235 [Phaeobacter inhibens]|uniref:helix-turn-helix domain-containing protein n=1 Tax=Phaeobacter inhibens TaxID=221822 RepID=UPI0021A5BEB4|nr:helix-turn-helix domain-containing protein [Phaeobacter inhibens]UWR40232.1 hypothetical protein K4F85_12370 [Phaeobacter inhibens]UWR76613.1 hypothetical protein K4L04_01235 [Phaeobacter inhibens]
MADVLASVPAGTSRTSPRRQRRLMSREVVQTVADFYQLTSDVLIGPDQSRRVSWPRQMAMVMLRRHTQLGVSAIASALGQQCHTTVVYGCKQVAKRREQSADWDADFKELDRMLLQRRGGVEFVRHCHAHGRAFQTVRNKKNIEQQGGQNGRPNQ